VNAFSISLKRLKQKNNYHIRRKQVKYRYLIYFVKLYYLKMVKTSLFEYYSLYVYPKYKLNIRARISKTLKLSFYNVITQVFEKLNEK